MSSTLLMQGPIATKGAAAFAPPLSPPLSPDSNMFKSTTTSMNSPKNKKSHDGDAICRKW